MVTGVHITVIRLKHTILFHKLSFWSLASVKKGILLVSSDAPVLLIIIIKLLLLLLLLFTAIGLSPGGSGYFTCIQNMKLVTNKYKSGGLHEKHVVATWNLGNHLSICF